MNSLPTNFAAVVCPQCGTVIAPTLLSCPNCHRLVHADRLKVLADTAQQAAAAGDEATELNTWQEALALLPPESRQFAAISEKITLLSQRVAGGGGQSSGNIRSPQSNSAQTGTHGTSKAGKTAAGLGTIGLLLWKLESVGLFLLTKGKLLLAGLTKGSTFFTMLLSTGVYWTAWGWKFAVGLVLSIYVHEMGHVAMLQRYGIKATSPMFIPGVGAIVRLKQHIADPQKDARVGLAGPVWGTGAAIFTYSVGLLTGWPMWLAIAHIGAWINLFNLMPVWQLDGGRAFISMTRKQRWMATLAIGAAWFLVHEGMLLLLMICAAGNAISAKPAEKADRGALLIYVALIAVLSAMCLIKVPLDVV